MDTPPTSHSLLQRVRDRGDAESWRRLTDLYTPLIRRWVQSRVNQPADADDVVQEVLETLVRELPLFTQGRRPGSFRAWLRGITVNRIRSSWHRRKTAPPGVGGDDALEALEALEDPRSELSKSWDEEHDRHVARTLLADIRLEFRPATWHAFEQTALEGRPIAEVARELGLTPNAVLIARSRVLKRLREKSSGLLD